MVQSGKEPPNSQPLIAHKGTLERPIRSSGKFPVKHQGPLPAVTPGWSFRTLFLPRFAHRTYHGRVGFQGLFPEGWQHQDTPLVSGRPRSPGTPGTEDQVTAIRVQRVPGDCPFNPFQRH